MNSLIDKELLEFFAGHALSALIPPTAQKDAHANTENLRKHARYAWAMAEAMLATHPRKVS
jgi:hypothetical protein